MKVQSASVLKPVFAFLAPPGKEHWKLCSSAITCSSNEATDELVHRIGGLGALTDALSVLAGLDLEKPETWGSFMLDTQTLIDIYVAMLNSPGSAPMRIFHLMRHVHPSQHFGLPVCTPMKAGWDLTPDGMLVTNVVRLDHCDVEAYMGAVEVDPATATQWRRLARDEGPNAVVPLHMQNAPHLPWL